MKKLEKIILTGAFILMWAVLAAYAGGPIFSDEFLYIDAGLRNFAEPSYGNRYFHIYLQKFFMEIAPSPLWGIRVFWGFNIALTAVLVYLNSRLFFRDSNIIHGLISLAFFFSFAFITEYSGEPAVDITAMMMVMVYLTIYYLSIRKGNDKRFFAGILGMLAFLSFKTKETTIFINLLFLGFGFGESGEWSWKLAISHLKYFLFGLAGGIGIFIFLDGLVLGKPLFAVNPTTFGAVFSNYDFQPGFFFGPTSWYQEYFLDDLAVPFLLFLLSGVKRRSEMGVRRLLIWTYPLVMAVFVTVNMLKVTFGFIERFYFPALPVIASLAPQFLKIVVPGTKKQRLGFLALLAASFGLVLLLRSVLMDYSASLHFDFGRFLDSIYYPVVLSILLVATIWMQRYDWAGIVLPLFCLMALLLSPLLYTQKYFFRFPMVRERYQTLFYPFKTFKEELAIGEGDVIYISADLARSQEMLSDDPNDITGMYNFYFDSRISDRSVFLGYSQEAMPQALSEREFNYALLSESDIKLIMEGDVPEETRKEIEDRYRFVADPEEKVYLLLLDDID